jgi:hypothetical protein
MSANNEPLMPSENVDLIIAKAHDDSAKADFENARASIHTMLETAKESIENLAQIADQSQNPKAYEVLAKLIETGVSASKSLLELQVKIRDIQAIEEPINSRAKTVNNNLFVGSTTELQKMLQEMKNGSK